MEGQDTRERDTTLNFTTPSTSKPSLMAHISSTEYQFSDLPSRALCRSQGDIYHLTYLHLSGIVFSSLDSVVLELMARSPLLPSSLAPT